MRLQGNVVVERTGRIEIRRREDGKKKVNLPVYTAASPSLYDTKPCKVFNKFRRGANFVLCELSTLHEPCKTFNLFRHHANFFLWAVGTHARFSAAYTASISLLTCRMSSFVQKQVGTNATPTCQAPAGVHFSPSAANSESYSEPNSSPSGCRGQRFPPS